MAGGTTCETCLFFVLTNGIKGECRRYPPVFGARGFDLINIIFSWYPIVKKDFPVCGEYK